MKIFNFKLSKLNSQKGFSALELIITIAIFGFGILGIYHFFYPALTLTANAPFHITADYLAQEGIEIIKNIRDNNILSGSSWSQGFSICTTGCQGDYKTGTAIQTTPLGAYKDTFLNNSGSGFYSYDAGVRPTIFKRKITITQPGSDNNILKVDVLVTWNYNGNPFSYETVGYIYNY